MINTPSKVKDSTLSEDVRRVLTNYTRVSVYHRRSYQSCIDNYRFYYGKNPELGLGQYKLEAAMRLQKQNRHLVQHNFVLPLIDTLAGNLMQMKMDPSFIPVNAPASSLTEIPQKTAYSDREMMNWDNAVFDLTLGGLLHQACVKIGVSTKWDKRGNIAMESVLPNTTYPDPSWKTQCSSDCEHVWHEGWYTALQIMEMFNPKSDLIQAAADRYRRDGAEYGENNGIIPYRGDLEDKWGSMFKVIEQYDVSAVKKKCTYLVRPDGEVKIPKTIKEMDIPAWLNANYPDWQPFDIYEDINTDKVCTVKTICPTLLTDSFLEDRNTELQLQCTPFKFWSCSSLNGEPRGLIESIKDAQTYINYWSGMLTHKIQTEGGGGAQYVDPNMFENYAEFERFCANRNNPLENFKMKGGYMDRGITPARPVVNSPFPQEAYKNLEYLIDKVLPHISKVPPAMRGFSEGSGESGYLFRQKKAQADLQAWTMHYSYKNFWNDWYESYLLAVGSVYENEGSERQFTMNGGKETIKVNEIIELNNGDYGIKNDMTKLKEIRQKVIVTEKPESPTEKASNILFFSELANTMAKIPSKQSSVGILMNLIMDQTDFPEKDKLVLQNVNKLETELELLKLETAVTQAKQAKVMAEQQLEMTINPPPPPLPPGPSIGPDGMIVPAPPAPEAPIQNQLPPSQSGAPANIPQPPPGGNNAV